MVKLFNGLVMLHFSYTFQNEWLRGGRPTPDGLCLLAEVLSP